MTPLQQFNQEEEKDFKREIGRSIPYVGIPSANGIIQYLDEKSVKTWITSHDARRDEQIRDMVTDEIKRTMLLYKNADFSLDEEIARHIIKAVSAFFPTNNK